VRGDHRAVSVRRCRLPIAAVIPASMRRFDAGSQVLRLSRPLEIRSQKQSAFCGTGEAYLK